jgi:serine/threonine-protein kinase
MATVWRGRDLRLDRPVAVKILDASMMADPRMRDLLDREARTVARLVHPNIVAVHDVGIDDDAAYLVMELVEGHSLASIAAGGPLPIGQAISIASQVCTALAAAHHAGVVHRDVKPSNLLVTATGVVKVCDFGIARLQAATADATLTGGTDVVGTSEYLAPERATGAAGDARSDLYALGCAMYAMLAGDPPFVGPDPISVLHQHRHQLPQPLRAHRDDVPPGLDGLVMQLLAKDPADRPPSAESVGDRLTRISGQPIAVGGGAPAFDVGVAAPHTTVLPTLPPTASGPSPTMNLPRIDDWRRGLIGGPQRGHRRTWWLAAGIVLLLLGLVTVAALTRSNTQAGPSAGSATTGVTSPQPSPAISLPPPSATPSDQLAALQAVVSQQADAGQLDPHTATDLRARLQDIARRLRQGQTDQAAKHLAQLRDRLTGLQRDGTLRPEAYRALTSGLDQLAATLPTTNDSQD